MRRIRELVEIARDEKRSLLSDVDGVVSDSLDAAGDDDHAQAPLLRSRLIREREHLVRDAMICPIDQLVQVDETVRPRNIPIGESIERDPHHLLGAITHLGQPLDEVALGLEIGCELRQLGDRDALVSDPLEVNRDVQHGEYETKIGCDGSLLCQELADHPLDPVVPLIDLVVERNHLLAQFNVLHVERVDRRSERAEYDSALLLDRRLERIEGRLKLNP